MSDRSSNTEGIIMLCLSREQGQEIYIDGGRFIIRVLDIVGQRVRLGITAPKEVVVDRGEIHAAKLADAAAVARG